MLNQNVATGICGWRRGVRGLGMGTFALCAAVLAPLSMARADVIGDVNQALLQIIRDTSAALVDGPPEVAREIAMINGAMHDAVNAARDNFYAPIAYHGSPDPSASEKAAALQAALTVMNNLYLSNTSLYHQYEGVTGAVYYGASSPYAAALVGPTVAQMTDIAAQISALQSELTALGNDRAVLAGINLGAKAGNNMLAARANDGANAANLQTLTPFVPPNAGAAGVYVPPAARPAMTPTWGTVTPFGMSSWALAALEQTVPAPFALTSAAYAAQILETECAGFGAPLPAAIESACTTAGFPPESGDEAGAALFWNDPGTTFQPPGHWLQITENVATSQHLDLLAHAREAALVGMAMSNAGTSVWAIKYRDLLWRPVTAIKFDCGTGTWSPYFTTCDASWTSLIATPPHPDYIAGHPGFSGAAATVLAGFFATDNIAFSSTSDVYCNGGTTNRAANGVTIIGCTLNNVSYPYGGSNGTTYCNNAPTQYGGYAVTDPRYNASPLICPITINFTSFSQGSTGFLGAEFSRVVGGIHTPMAVQNAAALGTKIGAIDLGENLERCRWRGGDGRGPMPPAEGEDCLE